MKPSGWLALWLVTVIALSGCALVSDGDLKRQPEKIQLTLWYWNRSIDDALIAQVEEQFPHIELNAQKIGGDFKAKLKTTLAAKSGEPDIVALNDWIMELFPSADRFYDLYELGAADVEHQYLEWKWKQGVTPDGRMIGFPMDTGPTALYYRADLFEKAGLPTDPEEVSRTLATWEDYIAAGEQLKEALEGAVFLTDNIGNVYNQVMAQGTELYFTPDGEFIGDRSERVKKAWDIAVKMHEKDLLADIGGSTPEWNAAMNNGRIASFVGAVWMKQILQEAAPDTAGLWRVARAPEGDGNNGGSFISILKSSPHPQEAYEVIQWLQSPENQLTAFQTMNLFPATPGVFDDASIQREEAFFGNQATGMVFAESARNVNVAYFGERYPSTHSIMQRYLTNIANQNLNPDETWPEALQRIERELQR